MSPDRRLASYVVGFMALWAIASSETSVLLILAIPSIVWAVGRAVVARGRRTLPDDVRHRASVVRRSPCELLFLAAVPILFTAAFMAAPTQREPVLIALSFAFAATHLPHAMWALDRHVLRRSIKQLCVGVTIACAVAYFDVAIISWLSALLAPTTSSCTARHHPLKAVIAAIAKAHHTPLFSDWIAPIVVQFGRLGEVPLVYPALVVMYVFGELATLSPRARRYLQVPLTAVVYTGVVCASLKIVVHRERPMVRGEPYIFSGVSTTWRNAAGFSKVDLSLPSGHVAVTMAVARCLVQLWMKDFHPTATHWISGAVRGLPFYMISIIVGLSRSCGCKHWPSDCVIGAVIGFVLADALVIAPLMRNYLPPPPATAHRPSLLPPLLLHTDVDDNSVGPSSNPQLTVPWHLRWAWI
jgi:hypothetical protein